MKRIFSAISLFIFLAFAVTFTACNDQQKNTAKSDKVTVMIYSEYIDPAMLADFEQRTGFKLQLELYEAQEEMIGKLQAVGTSTYDVIIATDVVIQQMIHLGLIGKLDTTKIPNRINIADQFRNPTYDPTNEYSVPYLWGTAGILYRDTINPLKVSYNMIFDANQTKGNFSLLEENRSMLGMALMAKGYDANSTNPDQLSDIVRYILQAKKDPHFIGIDGSVGGKDKVLSKLDWAAVVFNGEAMAAIAEDSTLQFGIPIEGSFMWVDAMLLSSKAPNPEGAYAFMNYILDAKIGAQLAEYINYGTPNRASLEFVSKDFKNNRVINPTKEEIARLVFLKDVGDASRLYDEAWTTVRTR